MYEQTLENNTVIPRLKYILHAEGMIDMATATPQYQYYLKDHLGNIRVVVNSDNTAQQITNYYAFGLTSQSYQSGTSNKYLYNGKELQDDLIAGRTLDWLDYGARMYNPQLGRWHSVDPLAEKYFEFGPYHYVRNNPINLIDPTGMSDEEPEDGCDAACQKRKKEAEEYWRLQEELKKWFSENILKNAEENATDDFFYQLLVGAATLLRESVFEVIPGTGVGPGPKKFNPFYKAEAIYGDIGSIFIAGEFDYGVFFILVGNDIGTFHKYKECAGGGSAEISLGLALGRVDYTGDPKKFTYRMLYGERTKGFISASWRKLSMGFEGARSRVEGGYTISTGVTVGVGKSPFLINWGLNGGEIAPKFKW